MTYYYCNAALCTLAVVGILFLPINFVNLSPTYAQTITGDLYAIADLKSESVMPSSSALYSNASGNFVLDDNFLKKLSYQINLTYVGDTTSAHVHSGNEGQNGPIIVTLFNSSSSPTNIQFLEYENPKLGWKIKYPSNWLVEEQNEKVDVVTGMLEPTDASVRFGPQNSTMGTYLTISIQNLDSFLKNISLNEYAKSEIQELEGNTPVAVEITPFKIVEKGLTTISNNKTSAYKVVYSDIVTGKSKGTTIWALNDNKVYDITYFVEDEVFPTYLPIIERMIDSFEISNSTAVKEMGFKSQSFKSSMSKNNDVDIHKQELVKSSIPHFAFNYTDQYGLTGINTVISYNDSKSKTI